MAEVQGRYRLEPARRPGFPWAHLEGPGGVIAAVGRFSALNLFLGRGQRIRTIDGEAWRLRGVSWQRFVCPAVFNQAGLKLATSVPDQGSYAITCRDRGFALLPAEHRPGRPRRWELAEFEEPIASIRRNPYEAEIWAPIPFPALLLSFGLAAFGIMGEKDLTTGTSWAAPHTG